MVRCLDTIDMVADVNYVVVRKLNGGVDGLATSPALKADARDERDGSSNLSASANFCRVMPSIECKRRQHDKLDRG